MPVATADYLAGMRRLAAGVAIVTTQHGEVRAGLTATSVCSLNADPPRLLACVHHRADAHDLILASRTFAVNLLGPEQQALAQHFGGRDDCHGPARFGLGRWVAGTTGMPVLGDAAAVLECRLVEAIPAGTHSILIGEVEVVVDDKRAGALVHHDRAYHRLDRSAG
ncbi:MAG: flavin reductase family protein [Geminicoccaceae bacterium]